jgi:hypothetical protein
VGFWTQNVGFSDREDEITLANPVLQSAVLERVLARY